jgi:hypothetical protein
MKYILSFIWTILVIASMYFVYYIGLMEQGNRCLDGSIKYKISAISTMLNNRKSCDSLFAISNYLEAEANRIDSLIPKFLK